MSTGSTLLLAVLALVVMCGAVSAFSLRPDAAWNYYHFDGSGFIAGQPSEGTPFVAVRDRVQPVVLTRSTKVEAVALSADQGALAGICFIKSSGGKLAGSNKSGFAPCPRMPITITSGGAPAASILSDENGYFVALLTAGSYRISNGIFSAEAVVERGTTVLVPLLAGKRMAD